MYIATSLQHRRAPVVKAMACFNVYSVCRVVSFSGLFTSENYRSRLKHVTCTS